MIFSSAIFFPFLLAVLIAYGLSRNYGQRATVILIASIIFYASWKPAYLLLLFASLTVNYLFYAALMHKRSKALVVIGVTANILVLTFYKYLTLLFETGVWLVEWLGLPVAPGPQPAWLSLALPLGISFYTFHMLSVMIDVYRGEWTRRISFLSWTLYVTFFPHMIAGPILRASELVEQLERLAPLKLDNLRIGAVIFVGGLLKKTLLADNLSPIVDQLYLQPSHLNFAIAWVATIGFGLQIYFDFSGYSEMAIGLGKMFGVDLPRNFKYPYLARNVRDFWQRWHMTLSRWLRDYLYISMGGSRCPPARNMANLLMTMLLGGLWHGAGWRFVFWGFLHGIYLIAHRGVLWVLGSAALADSLLATVVRLSGWPVTMILVSFTWVFFRASDFSSAYTVSTAMMGLSDAAAASVPSLRLVDLAYIAAGALVVGIEPYLVDRVAAIGPLRWWSVPYPLRGLAYALLVLIVTVFGGGTQKFIYFDF